MADSGSASPQPGRSSGSWRDYVQVCLFDARAFLYPPSAPSDLRTCFWPQRLFLVSASPCNAHLCWLWVMRLTSHHWQGLSLPGQPAGAAHQGMAAGQAALRSVWRRRRQPARGRRPQRPAWPRRLSAVPGHGPFLWQPGVCPFLPPANARVWTSVDRRSTCTGLMFKLGAGHAGSSVSGLLVMMHTHTAVERHSERGWNAENVSAAAEG